MMRTEVFRGPKAGLAAAARLREALAKGVRAEAGWLADATVADTGWEFVAAHGALWPEQAYWLEWATGQPLAAAANPAGDTELLVLASVGDGDTRTDMPRDIFGRPNLSNTASGEACRIGIVGAEHHHRETNPAVLATLGDAADREDMTVQPVFLGHENHLDGIDGIILPGGSDMAQVAVQIAVAQVALRRGLPIFGLCLGMQSMATMLMREAGWQECWPEEVAGVGPRRSFVRWRPEEKVAHRLGDRHFAPLAGTALAALLPHGASVRMNHRYRLNPAFPDRRPIGAVLHDTGEDGIVDALELPGHPFFVGMQGHPEQGCDPALHAVWGAFLVAAANKT